MVGVDGRAVGCADAGGVKDVFVGDGDAVEGAERLAAGLGGVGGAGLGEGALRVVGYDGVDLGVDAIYLG